MRISPENPHTFFHKKLAFQEHQFWGSSMMTLSSFLTKFWSCRGKLIKIKQNKKHFVKISVNRLKMTLTCWIWTMLTTVAFVGHCYTFCLKRWIVLLSGTLFLPKSLLHCRCVRRTDFVAKYASVIFTGCCVVSRPVGSILVSRESPRPAVYITWKIWKKNCKTTLGWKTKQGAFFGPPCRSMTTIFTIFNWNITGRPVMRLTKSLWTLIFL